MAKEDPVAKEDSVSKAEDLVEFWAFQAKESEQMKREIKDSREWSWWFGRRKKENQAMRELKGRKEMEEELVLSAKRCCF